MRFCAEIFATQLNIDTFCAVKLFLVSEFPNVWGEYIIMCIAEHIILFIQVVIVISIVVMFA